ncbi:assimilatory sulfite reductase (ferredoxin) OS=Tsukamurella paurometabola (strain ATCC 8368 / DSM / CCUG 35730 / CIP 100753 / JCM 10117 / KCTC 9821 / NBRC 16120 / NCIMB 702349 / NCTC 13040) OX=521096 GN=Tpau_2771 PE=4 SV=1 [Tsukamurella paurometabola]|uniref:assimilatory sulfite reductase (ferredoxin) n=1 Tax=Tsukamurella paurometabola (strain ATCC 8368 / DSM 20162 / CCUG 35730 / CIP 100753 / JCM 10117 / KCTC 9821 / NBRC 16120 / NCIMB 702349 / NCTC 13040) TaxID=521096 RepID=D5UT84_TSUPD|nr:nitrite/sulfite reductase [Tsukamurella paurometabola]ADG79369.1 Sulfite reductase (ferredoxin) [Tsukamurella paurometabola DSM 20162]SUP35283.1 Sulfite reductase [ferredoxin] [Tsukamurella paurometabola]
MTSTADAPLSSADAAPARPARKRPAQRKSEGQWKLGYREPLNANEQTKKDDNPLNVRARIENIYSKQGFDSIDKSDLRGRMRWWGLYTQREQGYDGTYTGDENIDLLEAPYFMMRVRCDGGKLNAEQMRVLGEISTEFARDTADLSDRENVQYHWIEIENVPEIWKRLEAVGLKTTEACGDCPRVVLGSPLAGESFGEVLDPSPAIDEIVRRYIGDPKYSNLPRKFKTAISGQQDVVHEINDVAFVGVVHPEHGPGLDLWVGGGLSTNPMLAQRVGAWIPLDEVPDVWEGVVSIFRDYGYRRLRSKARLKFLVKDWGIEKFRQVLEDEYLGRTLIDGPAPAQPERPIDHIGVQKLRNGLNAVGFSPIAGRVSGTVLSKVADAMERVGSDRASFTPYQKLIVLDVPDDQVDSLIDELAPVGLQGRPSIWRRNLIACSGIEFCKLSFVETRKRSQVLVPELEQRLADINAQLDVPITVNINGCPNSCGRSQIADIGFKGQLVDDHEGNQVEGFQVHLGGSLGLDSGFGRKLRQHKVLSTELGDYIERVVRNFVAQREGDERFAQWTLRAAEEDLR